MIIDPLTDNTNFQPQIVASNLPKFLEQIKQMNSLWKPAHDVLLTPYLKSSNIFSVLSTTSQILLNKFPEDLIKCRFSFIKRLNELFNGEAGQLLLNDASQPLVSLIIQASSAFSSAMKLSRLEKIICKNFCQKKTFSFNRSRALLAKTHPESPEAKSLFEQVIDQIPINSLNSLKCKDAPWRVTLEGEGATDVGGPGRDLFTEVSSELCMPHNHIFIKTPRSIADPSIEEYIPDPRCTKVDKFVYAGAFIALAFVTRLQQPYKFADLIWSFLAGRKVTIEHIIEIDPSFGVTLSAASKGTLTDLHYTVKNIFGEEVELIPGGATIFVHPNDLKQYCQLASTFRRTEFDAQLKKMREGFSIFLGDICPQLVTPEELKSYICGSVDIPIQELRQLIQTSNATPAEEEMLYEEVNEWAATKKKLQNSVNIAVNNKQSLWTTISLPRGNMFRSFIYVKKSDILPVENSDIINNTNIQPSEVTALQSSIEKILPKTVETLAECTEYSDFVSKVKQFKTEGKLRSYARYAQLDNPEVCYLAIYNKDGKIVAILSPGNERHNINTGNPDSVANYSGCGAIGFVLDE